MNVSELKEKFNRGRMDIKEIKWLIDRVEQLDKEFVLMSLSVAECDAMIAQLQEEVTQYQAQEKLLLDKNKKQAEQIVHLRAKTTFKVYEENLVLVQEIVQLKKELKHERTMS